jgi:hypothetical protein
VISMRRLAIVFAILAVVSTVEHIVLSGAAHRIVQAPRRIRRVLITLIAPIRLFQRIPWLIQGN